MNNVKLIIINSGNKNKIDKYLNKHQNYVHLDIDELKIKTDKTHDYKKSGLFDKIEEDMIKTVLLFGYDLILVAIDRPDKYYRKIEDMMKGYEHLVNIKISYEQIYKKENFFKRILKRIN